MDDFEFLSSNLLISYPFSTPAPSVTVGVDTVNLGALFSDAILYVDSGTEQRVALKYFKLDQGSGALDITLNYADGTLLAALSSGSDVSRIETYGRWIVTELRREGDDPIIARFVLPDTAVDPLEVTVAGTGAVIEPSLVTRPPSKVKTAYLKVGANLYQLADEIVFDGGYNFDIEQRATRGTTARPLQVIRMTAEAGGGIGPFIEPAEQPKVRTIAGAAPTSDKGTIDLIGGECYTLTPIPENNELELRVICGQCCSCEDYVTVYEGLKALWDQAVEIGESVNSYFEQYTDLLSRLSIGGGGGPDPTLTSKVVSRPNFYIDLAWLVIIGTNPIPTGTDVYVELVFTATPDTAPLPGANYMTGSGELIFESEDPVVLNPTGTGTTDDPFKFDLTSYDHDALATSLWTGTFQASMSLEKETDPEVLMELKLFVDGDEVDTQEHTVVLVPAVPLD